MATIPYLAQGYDQLTGLRRGKKQRPRPPTSGSFTLLGGSTFPPGYVGGPGFVGGTPGSGQQQPGPITTPGYTPNYADLIQQALAPLQAQLGAEGSADAATRNAALIRGIGQFGEQFDPSGAQAAFGQDFYNQAGLGGLLGQANQLAGETTRAGFSVSSKLKDAFAKNVQQIQDSLAARGLLRSGATGVALQGAQKEYDTGQYDARQSLTDYLSSAQQGYVAGERQRQQQLLAAGREEAVRQAQLNPATGSQKAFWDPSVGAYRGPDGKLYNADGTVFTPAAATPASPAGGQAYQDIIGALRRRSQDQRLGFDVSNY